MKTERLVITIPTYKKPIALLVVLYFSFTLMGMALDQHFHGFSKGCLICRTKSSINGLEDSFILEFLPTITYHFFNQFLMKLAILVIIPFQNKSPPQSFSN
jgi:hypothetical protein